MITIYLDWPARELSPNARVHFRARAEFVKLHRILARLATLQYQGWTSQRIYMAIVFHPPDRLHRDMDNAYSMCKAYQDGIFDALGMNDSRIKAVELRWGDVRPGGMVQVTLMEDKP